MRRLFRDEFGVVLGTMEGFILERSRPLVTSCWFFRDYPFVTALP
ncbi:hypothetical protein V5735_07360 (plasmid) [Haladaptatus sp. SPP-AMP-3]